MEKRVMLCKLTNIADYQEDLQKIRECYEIDKNIFVFKERENEDSIFITFNTSKVYERAIGTFVIHRKKEWNCLFTVNAINLLCLQETGKFKDINYVPDFNKFSNSAILTKGTELNIVPIKLIEVIRLDKEQ
jgi:hypothetical protein